MMVNVPCPQCGAPRMTARSLVYQAKKRRCRSCAYTKHGAAGTRLHNIWHGIRKRTGVTKPNERARHYYVDRGIELCDEWRDNFEAFRDWSVANGYADGLTIDRRDNDLGYSPSNCRWVTQKVNARNSSKTILTVEAVAEIKQLMVERVRNAAIAEQFGVTVSTITEIGCGLSWADVPFPDGRMKKGRAGIKRAQPPHKEAVCSIA